LFAPELRWDQRQLEQVRIGKRVTEAALEPRHGGGIRADSEKLITMATLPATGLRIS
jgi:hypothetical protein